jgi:adenylate cyclase class IV
MIEVELKAHLRDRRAAEASVSAFARLVGSVDKFDSYWHGPDWRRERGTKGFRIRAEDHSTTVTFKNKRVENGLEVNLEREFGVGDPEIFVEFCRRLGCESFYTKRKRGSRYIYDSASRSGQASAEVPLPRSGAPRGESPPTRPATIEIVEVEGLGDFIEIEILLEDEEPEALARAQAEIRGLLERAGVDAAAIESRFYSELLMEAGKVPRS